MVHILIEHSPDPVIVGKLGRIRLICGHFVALTAAYISFCSVSELSINSGEVSKVVSSGDETKFGILIRYFGQKV